MSLVAVVPAANTQAANASLESQGFGPGNFSVPAYGGASAVPAFAALHAWQEGVFAAAIKAIPGVVWEEGDGDPGTRTQALIQAQGARWPARAPDLPNSGNAIAGTLYRFGEDYWRCIQTFSRSTYNAHPSTYPALIRRVRIPGVLYEWYQPIDGFDAWKLLNPFTGQPEECLFNGEVWYVTQADGSGNNIWQPGVFGWTRR